MASVDIPNVKIDPLRTFSIMKRSSHSLIRFIISDIFLIYKLLNWASVITVDRYIIICPRWAPS